MSGGKNTNDDDGENGSLYGVVSATITFSTDLLYDVSTKKAKYVIEGYKLVTDLAVGGISQASDGDFTDRDRAQLLGGIAGGIVASAIAGTVGGPPGIVAGALYGVATGALGAGAGELIVDSLYYIYDSEVPDPVDAALVQWSEDYSHTPEEVLVDYFYDELDRLSQSEIPDNPSVLFPVDLMDLSDDLEEQLTAVDNYYANFHLHPGATPPIQEEEPEEEVVEPPTGGGGGGDNPPPDDPPPPGEEETDDEEVVTTPDTPPVDDTPSAPPYYDYDNPGPQPIILDLDGDGVEVTFGEEIFFDTDGDGFLERTSWAAADDGFLVFDLNADGTHGVGDGVIDQAEELALALSGEEGDTDLQALARFDLVANGGNNDGFLSATDAIWSELRVWQDIDQDGKTENDGSELKTLADWGISQIGLKYDDGTAFDDTSNDMTVVGTTLFGLASFVMNGQVMAGGVGDVQLATSGVGWRRIDLLDTVGTVIGYSIEFEGDVRYDYGQSELVASGNFDLTAMNLDGAEGDARDNILDASNHVKSVSISGGDGNDVITGGFDDDMLSGDSGADELRAGEGDDVVFFDAEDTVVEGGDDYDIAFAVDEDEYDEAGVLTQAAVGVTLDVGVAGFEAAYGGDGDDTLVAVDTHGDALALHGGRGDDVLTSGAADDLLSGDEGDDVLRSNKGDDTLIGGSGDDTLYAGEGSDYVLGGTGDDTLRGNEGDDFILAGYGQDDIAGGEGDDYIDGGAGSDTITAGIGDDFIIGGSGYDNINAGKGDDYVDAGSGNDVIEDSNGDDVYFGGKGDDTFIASVDSQGGKDQFHGGFGRDILVLDGNRSDYDVVSIGHGQYNITKTSGDGSHFMMIQDIEKIQYLGAAANNQIDWLAGVSRNEDNFNSFEYSIIADEFVDEVDQALEDEGYGKGDDFVDGAETGGFDELINGGNGNDTLNGESGDDTINGDAGSDVIHGGKHADDIDGGSGDDLLVGGDGQDEIVGGSGSDTIIGDGNNHIGPYNPSPGDYSGYYQSGDYVASDDDGGADILKGQEGDDTIIGGKGADQIFGGEGADFIDAGIGNDTANGGSGADTLYGGDGSDTLNGGMGDDVLVGDAGYSTNATVHFARYFTKDLTDKSTSELRADQIETGVYSIHDLINSFLHDEYGSTANGDTFEDVSIKIVAHDQLNLTDSQFLADILPRVFGRAATANEIDRWQSYLDMGATYADVMVELVQQNFVKQSFAKNTLVLFEEYTSGAVDNVTYDDTIDGGKGKDQIYGGRGVDILNGGDGKDYIEGGKGSDEIFGGKGKDKLLGGFGQDLLVGGAGADVLEGGVGADTIHGGKADGTGGNPFDALSYEGSNEGVTIDLAAGTASGGDAEGDTYTNIEWVVGSYNDDNLTGDNDANRLFGKGGTDHLKGGGGHDHLFGGAGSDLLEGQSGDDRLYGNGGADMLVGGSGDDLLIGGSGDDILTGGAGEDLLVGDEGADVYMLQDTGEDTVEEFELGEDTIGLPSGVVFADLTITQDGDDTLVIYGVSTIRLTDILATDISEADFTMFADGTVGNDVLDYSNNNTRLIIDAGAGDDTVTGSDFNDVIEGGTGDDLLQGGDGDDTYVINLPTAGGGGLTSGIISDTSGINTLRIVGTISVHNIASSTSGNDLTLTFGDTGQSVTITDQWVDYDAPAVQFIELSSGEIIDLREFHDMAGDDVIDGDSGANTINGHFGDDTIEGKAGNDTLYGDHGNDLIEGGNGDDTIYGGEGNDVIKGGEGYDIIDAGNGDDLIYDGFDTGDINGGDGIDTLKLSSVEDDYTIDLENEEHFGTSGPVRSVINVENVIGTQGANTIIGSDEANFLDGQDGADTITGGKGTDFLVGGKGSDTYIYNLGDGSDTISDKGGAADEIHFGAGITATDLDFSTSGSDVFIHLPDGETIRIRNFESKIIETLRFDDGTSLDITKFHSQEYIGTAGDNSYYGKGGNDTIKGKEGNDTLSGGKGNDLIKGGEGNDLLYGKNGNDEIHDGAGVDHVYAGSGDDVVVVGGGGDFFDGGSGSDMIDYFDAGDGVTVDLRSNTSSGSWASNDTVLNFESVSGSDSGADVLKGTDGATILLGNGGKDYLSGLGGDDVLHGGDGDDILLGGQGNDTLNGGLGGDVFVFNDDTGIDKIEDFNINDDIIQLAGFETSFAELIIEDTGAGTTITFAQDAEGEATAQILLYGVHSDLVTSDLFEFAEVDEGLATDWSLAVGTMETAELGNSAGGGSGNIAGVVTAEFTGTNYDLKLNFDAFDVDTDAEIEVFLNGISLGYLDEGVNDGMSGYSFLIAADQQFDGKNVISFNQQANVSHTWAITDVMLKDNTKFGFHLEKGVTNQTERGNDFNGLTNEDQVITAEFAGSETDLLLSFSGYDIDHENEVEIFLNGESLGYLDTGVNNGLDVYQFEILSDLQVDGVNVVAFVQQGAAGNTWGITDVLVDDLLIV